MRDFFCMSFILTSEQWQCSHQLKRNISLHWTLWNISRPEFHISRDRFCTVYCDVCGESDWTKQVQSSKERREEITNALIPFLNRVLSGSVIQCRDYYWDPHSSWLSECHGSNCSKYQINQMSRMISEVCRNEDINWVISQFSDWSDWKSAPV